MATMLKHTVFADEHVGLGARMGAFAGWNMPIRYAAGTLSEHAHTRSAASLFDVSHMGELRVVGRAADVALDRVLARPVIGQAVGCCRYNFLMTECGTVRDDLLVYRLATDEFLLVVNAGPTASDAAWIEQNMPADVRVADESDQTAKLDLQGPASIAVLADLGVDPTRVPGYFRACFLDVCGVRVLISRTGYTGERGVELYIPVVHALSLWQRLLTHSAVWPAGLAARDLLRLEMGYPLYGHELDRTVTPVEAGFAHLLGSQRREFIGRRALCEAPRRRLMGFALEGRRAARRGDDIWTQAGEKVGSVTSGAYAPSVRCAVALGYLVCPLADELNEGDCVRLGACRDRALPAVVASLPFYRDGTLREA